MNVNLTKEDINSLKYECRPGIIIPLGILLLSSFLTIGYTVLLSNGIFKLITYLIIVLIFILSVLLSYFMMRKYLIDIKNNKKIIELMKVEKKIANIDFEAGSGSIIGQKMKRNDSYYLIIANFKYKVSKEIYNKCEEGKNIYLHYAPISNHLLKIEPIKHIININNHTL